MCVDLRVIRGNKTVVAAGEGPEADDGGVWRDVVWVANDEGVFAPPHLWRGVPHKQLPTGPRGTRASFVLR